MTGFPVRAKIITKYVDSNHRCVAYKLECTQFSNIGIGQHCSKIYTISKKEFKEKILNNELVCNEVSITKDNRMIDSSKAKEVLYLDKKDRENINMTSKILQEYREELKKRIIQRQKDRELAIGHNGNSLLQATYDSGMDKTITEQVIKILSDDKIVADIIDRVLK